MFKIKVRPHKENRYLYNVIIYERATWLCFTYWKWWCENQAIADWAIDKFVLDFRTNHKVISIDFLVNQPLEL